MEEVMYTNLTRVLEDAARQASDGKGKERHAVSEPFEQQKICVITRWLTDSPVAGPLFQAVKKSLESSRMKPYQAIHELYGAINYLAAAIIVLEESMLTTTDYTHAALGAYNFDGSVKKHIPCDDVCCKGD